MANKTLSTSLPKNVQQSTLQVGHSPDPDDAFMFYAIAHNKINTHGFTFEHVIKDIETLNSWAMEGKLPITAISLHAYAYVADKYAIMQSGASIGDKYGPILVSKKKVPLSELRGKSIAIPGKYTTAALVLSMALEKFNPVIIPFDKIIDAVLSNEVEAGLIIHEGQLTYNQYELHKIIDLGEWWYDESGGLPLPLGLDVIRKDLGDDRMQQISQILKDSIHYAHNHRKEAIEYALQYGRGLSTDLADKFVGMYVNQATLSMGERERKGIAALLMKANKTGLIPCVSPMYIEV